MMAIVIIAYTDNSNGNDNNNNNNNNNSRRKRPTSSFEGRGSDAERRACPSSIFSFLLLLILLHIHTNIPTGVCELKCVHRKYMYTLHVCIHIHGMSYVMSRCITHVVTGSAARFGGTYDRKQREYKRHIEQTHSGIHNRKQTIIYIYIYIHIWKPKRTGRTEPNRTV